MDKIDAQGRQSLLHECRAYSTAKSQVTLTLTESGELQSHSWYKLPTTTLLKGMEPVYLCSSMRLGDCQSLKYSKPVNAYAAGRKSLN